MTSQMLAEDALELVNHVWGNDAELHLYGVSMGGMVVQEMALSMIRAAKASGSKNRVKSLFLSVTCRGIHIVHGVEPIVRKLFPFAYDTGIIRYFMPLLIKSSKDDQITVSDESIIKSWVLVFVNHKAGSVVTVLLCEWNEQSLINRCFSRPYLDSYHPNGKRMEEVWREQWHKNYEEWSTFHDSDTCAQQIMVLAHHYLCDEGVRLIRETGITVTSHIALADRIIFVSKQKSLAEALGARRILTDGGHMGDTTDQRKFFDELLDHFRIASSKE